MSLALVQTKSTFFLVLTAVVLLVDLTTAFEVVTPGFLSCQENTTNKMMTRKQNVSLSSNLGVFYLRKMILLKTHRSN